MLHAARELLIDLERHELTLDDQEAAEQLPNPDSPSVVAPHSEQREHREQLLSQLDRLKETVVQEQTSNSMLRSEKSKLSGDMRHLAQELRQERAASNAVLAVRMGTEAPADGGAKAEAAHGELGSGTGGLTLASAASQIIMLRREVKWLQKQWHASLPHAVTHPPVPLTTFAPWRRPCSLLCPSSHLQQAVGQARPGRQRQPRAARLPAAGALLHRIAACST